MRMSKSLKRLLKGFIRMFRNNLVLKIAALIFAVILWSYVMAGTNPPRPKSLDNIPVKITNLESLKARGLTVSENLSNLLKSVRINLEVKQKELTLVNADNVSASIDFSKTNGKGEVEYKITGTTKYGTIISIEPSAVILTVDDYIKKQIPVKYEVKGQAPEGLYVGEPSISPNVIEIAGARKDVEKAALAVCEIDVTGKNESINQSMDVKILDQEGNALDKDVYFENLPSVIVKIDILPITNVPVNAAASIINASRIKEGYELGEVRVDPSQTDIAASKPILDSISEVVLSDMDVAGASANMVFTVQPKAIEGVRFLNKNSFLVTVNIAQIQSKKDFYDIPVAVLNRPKGFKVFIEPKTVDATVFGGIKDIEQLNKNNLKFFVDLSGMQKGVYSLPIRMEDIEPKTVNITLSMSEIKVTIK